MPPFLIVTYLFLYEITAQVITQPMIIPANIVLMIFNC